MKLLADTGALLALFNPRDNLHQRARKFAQAAGGDDSIAALPSIRESSYFSKPDLCCPCNPWLSTVRTHSRPMVARLSALFHRH